MAAAGSILGISLRDWTWEALDTFLQLHVRENEAIEYKAVFDTSLPDSMVAMANGDGGHIFIGVSEKNNKMPDQWPLLDGPKDRSESAYSYAASGTSPIVQLDARAMFAPDGKQVVVVRIPPGSYPPYMSREKGVRVRVGDGDVVPDLRTLELLFARRQNPVDARRAHRERVLAKDYRIDVLSRDRQPEPEPAWFTVLVSPLYGGVAIPLTDSGTRAARRQFYAYLARLGFANTERRSDDGFTFVSNSGDEISIRGDGDIRYSLSFYGPTAGSYTEQVPMGELGRHIYDFLAFAQAVYTDAADYTGDLYLGFGAKNLAGKQFAWPGMNPPNVIPGIDVPHTWIFDNVAFGVTFDPVLAMRQIVAAFGWRLGFDDVQGQVQEWGRGLEKDRQ